MTEETAPGPSGHGAEPWEWMLGGCQESMFHPLAVRSHCLHGNTDNFQKDLCCKIQ